MLVVCYDKNMTTKANAIVAVNAGSSSIKVSVFVREHSTPTISRFADVHISNIGQPISTLQILHPDLPAQTERVQVPNHTVAAHLIMEHLKTLVAMDEILAIGHRIVHGGTKYINPTHVSEISDTDWQTFAQLDPEHTPAARQLVIIFAQAVPSALQIACFDTAFFQNLPSVAKIVPIPKKYYEMGVRRYGFHGLSYASLLGTFREKAGETAANGRVIMAHLGSGASMTAMHSGKPVDTTMGFTPTSGLVMSTRSGDLDPNLFGFLNRQSSMSLEEFEHMVNTKSGLLGISGVTGDMRKLLTLEHEDENAGNAIGLFIHDVKKSIGALSAVLGGIDSLIFSGGIGEQSSALRARICEGLEYLGIELSNDRNGQNDFLISSPTSKVGVHIISTDEAQEIAAAAMKLLNTANEDTNGSN